MLPPAPLSAIAIMIQLGGSAMVLTGFLRWIGALSLAAFTFAAALIAHPFWDVLPKDRGHETILFIAHLGLVGAFMLLAWRSLGARPVRA